MELPYSILPPWFPIINKMKLFYSSNSWINSIFHCSTVRVWVNSYVRHMYSRANTLITKQGCKDDSIRLSMLSWCWWNTSEISLICRSWCAEVQVKQTQMDPCTQKWYVVHANLISSHYQTDNRRPITCKIYIHSFVTYM